jgi:ATP-dependent Clp protease ATP-binding subunit ClpA
MVSKVHCGSQLIWFLLGLKPGMKRHVKTITGSGTPVSQGGRTVGDVFERFSQAARTSIGMASGEAGIRRAAAVEVEHLVLGLLHDPESIAGQALSSCGLRLETARNRVLEEDDVPRDALSFGITAKSALEGALRNALAYQSKYIEPEHVLLAALESDESRVTSILAPAGTTVAEVRSRVIGFIQAGQFEPAIVSGLVREYHYESRLDEYGVARVQRVFGEGGTSSFLDGDDA